MKEMISILEYLANSNAINFIIMAVILALIVKKLNLGSSFDLAVNKIKSDIEKSENEKTDAQNNLTKAEKITEKLPNDIKKIEKTSQQRIAVYKAKVEDNTRKTLAGIEHSIERTLITEEKKISDDLLSKTSKSAVQSAKERIINMLKENPELHNKFISDSLDELEKIELL